MRVVVLLAPLLIASACPALARAAEQPEKTLQECIAIALEHHPSLKAAAATVEAGTQRVWQAASGYLPQVNANYVATRQGTSVSARTQTQVGTTTTTYNFYNTGVSFSQRLFDFGKVLDGIRAAQATEQSLQADESTQRETVVLNVKQSYYNLLAARRLLAVADETVHQNQQHLDLAQGRFQVGLAPKFDVTNAQVQVANADLNRVTARNNVSVARETLRNALGLTEPMDFDIVDDLGGAHVTITQDQALKMAYDNRPELRSIQAQERADTEQIAALKKDYLPYLAGNGGYNWSGSDYPLQSSWNIGASVNLSIFNGGLTTAQIGEAEANLSNLKYNEEVLRQNIALEVRQAVLNMQQAVESIRVSATALRQARENLELAEGRYQTGVGNIIELTDAQASLTTAEANHVQALYNHQTAIAAVEKATAQSFPGDD